MYIIVSQFVIESMTHGTRYQVETVSIVTGDLIK